jgi:DNA-binding response OmpR family regulator
VVEDDPDLCEALAAALRRKGYEVVPVGDGAEAIRLLAGQPPDVAVLDMMLPGASGFQVARLVKERSDGRVPVLMISGNSSAAHQDYAFAAGADRFLPKPFSLARFLDAVTALCPPAGGSRAIPMTAVTGS